MTTRAANRLPAAPGGSPSGNFVTIDGQRYARIHDVDGLEPFLVSVVNGGDGWLFVGSNSAITAGRVDADGAIFPYQTADKMLRHPGGSGVLSAFRVRRQGSDQVLWEPWRTEIKPRRTSRNLYKHVLGTSLLFEEINEELGLRFVWSLEMCEEFGLVRRAALENLGGSAVEIEYVDGFQMLVPPGVGEQSFARLSYLAAGYMRHEVLPDVPLAIYTLNSAIQDKPLPYESLLATCAWSIGLDDPHIALSDRQARLFRAGEDVRAEVELRGDFGSYLAAGTMELAPESSRVWYTVADTGLDHAALVRLRDRLGKPEALEADLRRAVELDQESLRHRIAAADGLQDTADESASVYHFTGVVFNCMRGGTFRDSYRFPRRDLAIYLRAQNAPLAARHDGWLAGLPETLTPPELRIAAEATGDAQLIRLCGSYLPLTYSRRHGDPSRPWNRFSIHLKDASGEPVYGYEGNWRDIFQNWDALAQSYPEFLEQMLAVFVNDSTPDGYNAYRISRDGGIDWELGDPDDPWGHIGYWGDHQIVYLLRLLESQERFHPGVLSAHLNRREYSYANVPYRICGLDAMLVEPHQTISVDLDLHLRLLSQAKKIGADAKLVGDESGEVRLVTLAEKLLVPVLVKLTNFVPEGGTWLNTQRPEWNDANNALAGWGLSMVTVCHTVRYLRLCARLFAGSGTVELSSAVADLLARVTATYRETPATPDAKARFDFVVAAGRAGEAHRNAVYAGKFGAPRQVARTAVQDLVNAALPALERAVALNRRPDGLCHAYNFLHVADGLATVTHLYPMLEGQAAVLSSGLLSPAQDVDVLRALRASELYRADQKSYLLYPDETLPSFLRRNTFDCQPPLENPEIFVRDTRGEWHFESSLRNAHDLALRLDRAGAGETARAAALALWEETFHHREFTGRSRTFFMFEGLGSIYWHMVAKLLLAVQESYDGAVEAIGDSQTPADSPLISALADAYDEIRDGLGFRKSAQVHGAFPCDPYSHTPRGRGAQQPGMTGLVKETVLTRWGELGIQVADGCLRFAPRLLHRAEFQKSPYRFDYVDLADRNQGWELPARTLAFTYCGTPVCFELAERASILVERTDGPNERIEGDRLPVDVSQAIFRRDGSIRRLTVRVLAARLRGGTA